MTDRRIRAALEAGFLLEPHTWDERSLRHASYMLRLGESVHVRRAEDAEFTVIQLRETEPVLRLQPGSTAKLYSLERLRLPTNVLGFTVARGLLFAHPLAPENTYIDPGFEGSIYTVVSNITTRVVELNYKMPITRLFFYRLEESVAEPYRRAVTAGIVEHLVEHEAVTPSSPEAARRATFQELVAAAQTPATAPNLVEGELFRRLRQRLDYLTMTG